MFLLLLLFTLFFHLFFIFSVTFNLLSVHVYRSRLFFLFIEEHFVSVYLQCCPFLLFNLPLFFLSVQMGSDKIFNSTFSFSILLFLLYNSINSLSKPKRFHIAKIIDNYDSLGASQTTPHNRDKLYGTLNIKNLEMDILIIMSNNSSREEYA